MASRLRPNDNGWLSLAVNCLCQGVVKWENMKWWISSGNDVLLTAEGLPIRKITDCQENCQQASLVVRRRCHRKWRPSSDRPICWFAATVCSIVISGSTLSCIANWIIKKEILPPAGQADMLAIQRLKDWNTRLPLDAALEA